MSQLPPALAQSPISSQEVLAELDQLKAADADWHGGRVPMYIFHARDDLSELSRKSHETYFSENAHATKALPSVAALQDSVIQSALSLFRASGTGAGVFTSGGTESIFLAMAAARDRALKRGLQAKRPKIIVPSSGHPGFDKAAHYLGLQVARVPVLQSWRADVERMADAIDSDTIALVGSAPSFPHGVIDPIANLAALARSRDLWFHVDACVGGYIAPFLRHLGQDIQDFDFSLDGVASISADLHKYGYAPKPASTLLFCSAEHAGHTCFAFDDWPRGQYVSTAFGGTRPAGPIAASWALMRNLGVEGYANLARQSMEIRDRLIAGISSIEGLFIVGRPDLTIFAYGAEGFDIHAVGDCLEEAGWFVARNVEPPSLHFMAMPVHAQAVDAYLSDLVDAVRQVRQTGRLGKKAGVIY